MRDTFATLPSMGMETTGGTEALGEMVSALVRTAEDNPSVGSRVTANAQLVDHLCAAGIISKFILYPCSTACDTL